MTYTVNTQYNTQKTHTFHSPPQKKIHKSKQTKQNKTNKKEQKKPTLTKTTTLGLKLVMNMNELGGIVREIRHKCRECVDRST